MEIERKFLIKEGYKVYPCPYPVNELLKEIKNKGRKIIQNYLPVELIEEIKEHLGLKIRFKVAQLRVRKYGRNYFLTMKSSHSGIKREEFEKKISQEVFDAYSEFKEKTLEKIRLLKRQGKNKLEFDYYPKRNLIVCEVEFLNLRMANLFKTHMKEITSQKEYANINLAENVILK